MIVDLNYCIYSKNKRHRIHDKNMQSTDDKIAQGRACRVFLMPVDEK